jgi:uncharacterized phage protein gp47/JayE
MQITELVYIDDAGYHFADYPAFLTWLQNTYKAIYGEDSYLEPDSQDGQLLAILAQAFYDTAALGGSVYNSFSPVTAQGVGLSRNVKINGLARRIPTRSTADLTIVGQSGTVITNGVAIDILEQKWNLPVSVLIPDEGEIIVTATADEDGAIAAGADSINRIFTPTLGWQTVNNEAEATPGAPVESDAELRLRQAVSTANPSLTVLEGTIGGVSNLTGVSKVRGYENDTNSTDGDGIPAHSVSLVVVGGDVEEIAQEIALHKTPGTGTYGTTSRTVYDSHGMPLDIKFYRPTDVTIKVQIVIEVNESWSSDYEDLIKAAVADVINANQIGNTVLITKLFAPAYLIGTPAGQSYDIVSLEIGKNSDPLDTINIPLAFNEDAVCIAASDVTVSVT